MDDDRAYKLIRSCPEKYSESDREELIMQFEYGDAYKRGIRKHLDRIAYKMVEADVKAGDPSVAHLAKYFELEAEFNRLRQSDIDHRNQGKRYDQWFLTFNPPEDISPADMWSLITEYFAKNCPKTINGYWARIEQRSEDPDSPYGWHVHVVVQYVEPFTRSQLLQRMRSVVYKLWTEEQRKHKNFLLNWMVAQHLVPEHERYMQGIKTSDKMLSAQVDKIVRPLHGFPENLSGGARIIFPGTGIVSENGIPQISPEEAGSQTLP